MRWWRFSRLVWALAKSPRARDQVKYILARRPLPEPPGAPDDQEFIDVRHLIETLSVEELARTADEYFQLHRDTDVYVAKPFNSAQDAPDLVIAFGHVLAGLNPAYGSDVLDFGAGTCWSTRFLTQMGLAVTAMDVSKTALEIGQELFRRLPVAGHHVPPTFSVFDGHRFDLADGSVDRIMCLNALHHVPNPQTVLREMARVLRPGGIAGFSEPGAGHSRSQQSQYEMRHFKVVENDIVMEDVERWSLDAGFTSLRLAVFDTRPYLVTWTEYQDIIDGGIAGLRYEDYVRHAARDRRAFFLYKEGAVAPDSRRRPGLNGVVRVALDEARVPAGGELRGEIEVVNTGANAWLPSDAPFGPVLVGVQRFTRDGTLVERDFHRVWLPGRIEPGQSARFRFAMPAPPRGDHRLVFDLVSEHVCWFSMNGARTVSVDVSVGT